MPAWTVSSATFFEGTVRSGDERGGASLLARLWSGPHPARASLTTSSRSRSEFRSNFDSAMSRGIQRKEPQVLPRGCPKHSCQPPCILRSSSRNERHGSAGTFSGVGCLVSGRIRELICRQACEQIPVPRQRRAIRELVFGVGPPDFRAPGTRRPCELTPLL
jgi:hypothetical protein